MTPKELAEIRARVEGQQYPYPMSLDEVHHYYLQDVPRLLELVDILAARNEGLLESRDRLEERVRELKEAVNGMSA